MGVVFYSNQVEGYIAPKKGRKQALYIVRELLAKVPKQKETRLKQALHFLNSISKQKCIVFVLSDFLDAQYSDVLRAASRRHDVIGIKVYDKMDIQLPDAGLLQVRDSENGKTYWVDSSSKSVRELYQEEFFRVTAYSSDVFKKAGCDLLHIRSGEDYVKVLQRFFLSRSR